MCVFPYVWPKNINETFFKKSHCTFVIEYFGGLNTFV